MSFDRLNTIYNEAILFHDNFKRPPNPTGGTRTTVIRMSFDTFKDGIGFDYSQDIMSQRANNFLAYILRFNLMISCESSFIDSNSSDSSRAWYIIEKRGSYFFPIVRDDTIQYGKALISKWDNKERKYIS